MRVLLSIFIWAIGSCLVIQPVFAQVVINEVFPAPVDGTEWVELYNPSDTAVQLEEWIVEDHLSTPSVIHHFVAGIVIGPGEYLVIETNNKLNNSGDGIHLKNASQTIIDTMAYSTSTSDMSWSRQPNGTGVFRLTSPTKAGENPPLPTPTPSPSPSPSPTPPSPSPSPSSLPSPSPSPPPISPTTLQASEILACPESGELEWLEIYNPDPQAYTLTNWRVKDRSSNSRIVNTTVAAQSWGVITWGGSLLNNDGDMITLERPDGLRMFAVEFPGCHQQKSFMYHDDKWQETEVITQGGANIWQGPVTHTSSTSSERETNTSFSSSISSITSSSVLPFPDVSPLSSSQFVSKVVPWETLHFPASPLPLTQEVPPVEQLRAIPTSLPPVSPATHPWALASLWGGSGFTLLSSGYQLFRWYTEHYAQNSPAPF